LSFTDPRFRRAALRQVALQYRRFLPRLSAFGNGFPQYWQWVGELTAIGTVLVFVPHEILVPVGTEFKSCRDGRMVACRC